MIGKAWVYSAVLLSFMVSACATSPTVTLAKNFEVVSKTPFDQLTTANLKWLAGGHLRGRISIEDEMGLRYFQSIPRDEEVAFIALQEATNRGDRQSAGLLGMLYRQGYGVEPNLTKAVDLLSSNHEGFFDLTAEYGLALYQRYLTTNDNEDLEQAIPLLKLGDQYEYLPAINMLRVHFERNAPNSKEHILYKRRSQELVARKLAAAEAFADSQARLSRFAKLADSEEKKFNKWSFIATLSIGAFISYQSSLDTSCSYNCSPPSVQDLMLWGVL